MPLELKPSSPQIADSALRLPSEPPPLPADVLERFPSLGTWQESQTRFWRSSQNALNDFARAVLDVTEIAGVLVVDPNASSLYIKRGRGPGQFNDADTPFFVDRDGRFSLGTSVVWNPATLELVVTGTIIADAGVIGGWIISPTTLSKNNAVLDSAGQLALGTGNDIVILSATDLTYRLWVGNATAATATFSVTQLGAIFSTAGTIGGWSIGSDYLRDTANSAGIASTNAGASDVRFWAGDTFANRATAPFRVLETGAIWATSGTIGGFTLSATALTAGSGDTAVSVSTVYTSAFSIGDMAAGPSMSLRGTGLVYGLFAVNDTNQQVVQLYVLDFGTKSGQLVLANSGGTSTFAVNGDTGALTLAAGSVFTWGADTNLYRSSANTLTTDDGFTCAALAVTGAASASSFAGDGSNLTSLNASYLGSGTVGTARLGSGAASSSTWLRGDQTWAGIAAGNVSGLAASATTDTTNASNISSGTLANARLPSAISVSSLTASGEIRGATARFGSFTGSADVPVTGSVSITDDGGTTRKLATIA